MSNPYDYELEYLGDDTCACHNGTVLFVEEDNKRIALTPYALENLLIYAQRVGLYKPPHNDVYVFEERKFIERKPKTILQRLQLS